jgi:Na+/proline symporter
VDRLLFIILLFVALIAYLPSLRFQEISRLGCMGIMAEHTLPCLYGGVYIRHGHPYLFFAMACITKVVSLLLEEKLGNDTVANMAILAFLIPEGGMEVLHGKIFIRKGFMAIETLLSHKFSFCRLRGRGPYQKRDAAQEENHYQCNLVVP